jgi:glycosyltransferase involved in cell wall biosynthesis
MSDSKPLVCIGMPVYNEERFIRQALDSLLSQSFQDFVIIISDNASTDRTGDICLEYAAKDSRIRYYRLDKNLGSLANFNRTFKLCNSEYFFWASGHDLRHGTFISRCLEVLDNDTSIVLCYPLARWLESDNSLGEIFLDYVDTKGLDQMSAFHTMLWGLRSACPVCGMMRSSALKKTRLMSKTVGADRILLAELSLLGAVVHIPEPLLYVRRLPDWGDWNRYLAKSIGPTRSSTRFSLYLYLSWVCQFVRRVCSHTRNPYHKFIYALSILTCTYTKYRWILDSLRNRKKD